MGIQDVRHAQTQLHRCSIQELNLTLSNRKFSVIISVPYSINFYLNRIKKLFFFLLISKGNGEFYRPRKRNLPTSEKLQVLLKQSK